MVEEEEMEDEEEEEDDDDNGGHAYNEDADYETMRRHQEQLDDQSFSRWLKQARQGGEDI
ncbi:hypothetical protein RhiirC2_746966, partial [Rhizophagus irregularis]